MSASLSPSPRPSRTRRVLRWAGRGLLGVLALFAVLLATAYAVSVHKMNAHFDVPEGALLNTAFASDSALVAAGERLTTLRGCNDCHDADLGGKVMIDDPLLGRVVTANLTPGGRTASFTMADWDRAVRHGVRADGKGYLVMPANEFHVLSDADLTAMVAYLRSLPPVARALPSTSVRPLGHALNAAGVLDLVPAHVVRHDAPRTPSPPAGPTPEYGAYLASGCTGCHGKNYAGGAIPGLGVVAANLTPDRDTGLGAWSEDDLRRALRTGIRPDGRTLDPVMPIAATKVLSDTEIAALWAYFQTLAPVRNEKG